MPIYLLELEEPEEPELEPELPEEPGLVLLPELLESGLLLELEEPVLSW
jgi:hypothetical protein